MEFDACLIWWLTWYFSNDIYFSVTWILRVVAQTYCSWICSFRTSRCEEMLTWNGDLGCEEMVICDMRKWWLERWGNGYLRGEEMVTWEVRKLWLERWGNGDLRGEEMVTWEVRKWWLERWGNGYLRGEEMVTWEVRKWWLERWGNGDLRGEEMVTWEVRKWWLERWGNGDLRGEEMVTWEVRKWWLERWGNGDLRGEEMVTWEVRKWWLERWGNGDLRGEEMVTWEVRKWWLERWGNGDLRGEEMVTWEVRKWWLERWGNGDILLDPFRFKWWKRWIYTSFYYRHKIESMTHFHCFLILLWLCDWVGGIVISCQSVDIDPWKPGFRFHCCYVLYYVSTWQDTLCLWITLYSYVLHHIYSLCDIFVCYISVYISLLIPYHFPLSCVWPQRSFDQHDRV